MGSIWAIVLWKTGVAHPRFLLGGVVILFGTACLLALAFLIGVATSSTAVSLMGTYAVFFFAAILSAHDKIAAAVSSEWSARLFRSFLRTPYRWESSISTLCGRAPWPGNSSPKRTK